MRKPPPHPPLGPRSPYPAERPPPAAAAPWPGAGGEGRGAAAGGGGGGGGAAGGGCAGSHDRRRHVSALARRGWGCNGRNGPNGRPAPQQAALPGPCRSPRSPPRSLGALAAWGSGSPRGRRAAPRCHRCRARSRASAPLAASEVGRGFVPPAVAAAAMARGERVPPVPAVPGWQRRAGRCGEEPAGSVPESSWLQTALEALSWGWVKKKNAFGGNKGTAPDTSQGWRGVVTGLRSELRAGRKKV